GLPCCRHDTGFNTDGCRLSSMLDFSCAHRWKGSKVRSRLCAIVFKQLFKDVDNTFASTPIFDDTQYFAGMSAQKAVEHPHVWHRHRVSTCSSRFDLGTDVRLAAG
ncbi:MAG: hypothetical protein ACKPKO_37315, partial [Candidatus Fonsibacter sp.]